MVNLAVTWKVTETSTTAGLNFRVRFSASFSRDAPKTDPASKVAHAHSRAIFFKIELLEDSILTNFSEAPLSVRRGANVKWYLARRPLVRHLRREITMLHR